MELGFRHDDKVEEEQEEATDSDEREFWVLVVRYRTRGFYLRKFLLFFFFYLLKKFINSENSDK